MVTFAVFRWWHLRQELMAGRKRPRHPAGSKVIFALRIFLWNVSHFTWECSIVTAYSVLWREWVLKSGMLIAMSVYTYLRLIVDHGTPNLLPLRQKEVDFCISMLREKVVAKRAGNLCWIYSSPDSDTPMCFRAVHGVPDHRQRSGSSSSECCPHPGDGAAVERPASQPASSQPSVHR